MTHRAGADQMDSFKSPSDLVLLCLPMSFQNDDRLKWVNEREELMQETQHTQQAATEQHETKTRKQHECKWLQKRRRHTETNQHLLRERWENLLGTVSVFSVFQHFTFMFFLCLGFVLFGWLSFVYVVFPA